MEEPFIAITPRQTLIRSNIPITFSSIDQIDPFEMICIQNDSVQKDPKKDQHHYVNVDAQ